MTAPTTTAALTPEELAARIELVGTEAAQEEIRQDIAAAIRQHHEAQRAEIERLTKERDEALMETRIIQKNAADAFSLIDYIADKIGLPDDQELGEVAFALWLDASQERKRVMREALTEADAVVVRLIGAGKTYATKLADDVQRCVDRAALQPQETADVR